MTRLYLHLTRSDLHFDRVTGSALGIQLKEEPSGCPGEQLENYHWNPGRKD